jgi:hypothetical protein
MVRLYSGGKLQQRRPALVTVGLPVLVRQRQEAGRVLGQHPLEVAAPVLHTLLGLKLTSG